MDKNEYRAKLDEINDLVDKQDYEGALTIVDSIDWHRVRSARTLCMVGEIYEANQRYEDSRKLLLLAHQRAPIGKTVLYRLVELTIKMGNFDEAVDYYNQFIEISPNDNSRYILKYKIYRARRSPIQEQITILEEYKSREYTERWAYELARLYAKAGNKEKSVEECDDLILWFSDGTYVTKAMELKMKYASLSQGQQEKYTNRFTETQSGAAAAAITAASAAASKLVKSNTDELPSIESVRSRTTGKAPEEVSRFGPILESTSALQDKIAKGIRDVFSNGEKPEEEDRSVEEKPGNREEYVIKELEPETFTQKISETPENSQERITLPETAPVEDEAALAAMLAETASELARSVSDAEMPDAWEEPKPEPEIQEVSEPEPVIQEVSEPEPEPEAEGLKVDRETAAAAIAAAVAAHSAAAAEVTATLDPELLQGNTVEIPVDQIKEEIKVSEPTMDLEAAIASAVAAAAGVEMLPQDEADKDKPEPVAEEIPVWEETPAAKEESPKAFAPGEIIRHRLTKEEQKRLFTYFAPVPGLTEQIQEALDLVQESACQKTSRQGNLVIMGREGAGKSKLSEGIIKAICIERHMPAAKIAYLTADKLNEKDPASVVNKMAGGFLVIEKASALKAEAVESLSKAMEFKTNRLTVVLEDLKPGIKILESKFPEFMGKFDGQIVIPVFTNDELVSFAKTYSKETGYKIDDMAVLALYTLIGDNQNDQDPITVAQVKDMMDDAIARASKNGRRPGKKVGKRHLDEDGRIMLYEKDFDI